MVILKKQLLLVYVLMILLLFSGCSVSETSPENETFTFTDSCGREVELPVNITKVAPSGSMAQIILYTAAPDALAGWSSNPGGIQFAYFPEKYRDLPEFGQFYGRNVSLNMEALIAAAPDVIIDMGDKKPTAAGDMDSIQEQTGIPAIFIEATFDTYPEAYRTLGKLLGAGEQTELIARYIEGAIADAAAARAGLFAEDPVTVMFGTGESGLDCNARGSIHATVIEVAGATNAIVVPEVSNAGGGNTISMEQLMLFDPDVILFSSGGPYETVGSDPLWSGLSAIENGRYYEIPFGPYHFIANPPSVNQVIGIKWLGNLLYPDLYPYDITAELQEFYSLFWHYELSAEEARALLANSTFKGSM